MYTFGILAAFFLILSGIIFRKNIKENQVLVGFIVFVGTMVGSVIVNGVVGLDTPYTLTHVKTKELSDVRTAIVFDLEDTLLYEYACITYRYEMELESDGDTSLSHYVDLGSPDAFYKSTAHREKERIGRHLIVKFLPEGDSIPYYEVKKFKKIPDNKWVSQLGLPRGGKTYIAYIPNDSIHNVLMDQLNEKFYENETEKIAKLD